MASQTTKFVRVISGDKRTFTVPEEALRASDVAALYLDTFGLDRDEAFPFPAVNGDELADILKFCQDHNGTSAKHLTRPATNINNQSLILAVWYLKLAEMSTTRLLKLLRASDYCGVTRMYDACCAAVANRMRNRTPEQLKALFGKN